MLLSGKNSDEVDFDGLMIRDYTAGQTLGSSVAQIRVAPGISHRRAYSRVSAKFYFVIEGALEFDVAEDSWRVEAGDVVVVPREVAFRYRNPTESEARLLLVHTPQFSLDDEVFLDG